MKPELLPNRGGEGRRVLVGVGGGIAAYKVCQVISTLFKSGVEVRVILTQS
ncbi:MAG TPA: flavoprotein, partial [Stenomitos sp.]